jgi:chromosome segregation ATPase
MDYDEKLCDEKHGNIKSMLEDHEKRLNGHSTRLDKIEQNQSEFKIEIKNLCESLKTLTNTLKWFMGIWVTSLLGFFFYAIQSHIFK